MQKSTTSKTTIQPARLGTYFLSGLLGCLFCWAVIQSWNGSGTVFLPLIILTAFSASTSRSARAIFKPKNAYRAAALLGLAIGSLCWVLEKVTARPELSIGWLAVFFLAGLAGSMIASWLELGLSDETFIPSPQTTADIQRLFRQATPQPPRLPTGKRILDILLSLGAIIFSAPLWLYISVMIWLQDPGPVLFIKHCTGFRGTPFRLYKFRTMKTNAENKTGPVASGDQDGRVLRGCTLLRQTALDELPQLANILVGEMSFVGPRPLRSVVEIENIQHIPGYLRRFDTRPGLAGLAQVCGSNQTPSRDKLRYEVVYANNASLLFDLKLIAIAFLVVFYLRWKKDWDGRIPRGWLHSTRK